MRRIFVLINNTEIGGTERRLGRVFAHFSRNDDDVEFVINKSLWEKLVLGGVVTGKEKSIVCLPEPFGWLVGWCGTLKGRAAFFLKKIDYVLFAFMVLWRYMLSRPALFHVALGGGYVALGIMLLRPAHRFIITVPTPDLGAMVGVPWALSLYSIALARCSEIDALTDNIRKVLERSGFESRKIHVSPGSMVDLTYFCPVPPKKPWVVFAGRFVNEKNPLLFLEAIPLIARKVPEARFFLLGEGPLRADIDQCIAKLKLGSSIHIGFEPDPSTIFGEGVIFVSLQRQDNYPSQSLLEAMASGMASVATAVGLTWKLVDEATGVRVQAKAAEIAEAVVSLLQDSDRCAALGLEARRRVGLYHSEPQYYSYLETRYAAIGQTQKSE